MRVFVTGTTGFLGRTLVPELIRSGHDVIGLARNDASRSMITAMHATPYSGQGYSVERLVEALEPVHAIVHLATGLPASDSAIEDDWPHSSKIVVGLFRHLLEASEATGVRTVIFPSFYGVYGDHGDEWVTEETPLNPDPSSQQYVEAEQILAESTEMRRSAGIVLRMGLIYGSDASHTKGLLYALRNGQAPIGANPTCYWSQVHVEDAARAVRLALEQSPAGAVFNICDDDPVRKEQLFRDLAKWVGGPAPQARTATGGLLPYLGRVNVEALQQSVRMSNGLARQWLGFAPTYNTHTDGYRAVIRQWLARKQGA